MTDDALEPDTKDWTWVLERPCPECGFVAADLPVSDVPAVVRDNAARWTTVLARPDVTRRPDTATWSALEYACHVRDVFRVFTTRARLMLDEDAPHFANWDQDETALAERYGEQDPTTVAHELVDAADEAAATFAGVPENAWQRTGLRSNGSHFTVESLARYFIHDVVHHVHDVSG